jgi:hypothetical protein
MEILIIDFFLDTIQVKNRRQNLGYKRKAWDPSASGISFIMGSWALCWATEKGCQRAELLAIKDDENMHSILVRLYKRLKHFLYPLCQYFIMIV